MKRFLTSIILTLFFLLSLQGQQALNVSSYRSILLEDFDNPDEGVRWVVRGSRYTGEGLPKWAHVENWPKALHGFNKENRELKVLGVEAAFTQRGYNYLEIVPSALSEQGELVDTPIPLPSNVIGLDMWVWGSNYDYSVEVHVRDYRGIVHVLYVDRTRFHGWKHLATIIPPSIPRRNPYRLNETKMDLMKVVVWTEPRERSDGFFIYFDDIRALTSDFFNVVDGDRLADPDLRQQLWEDADAE